MATDASLFELLIMTARLASRCLETELGRVGILPAHVPVYLALADNLPMTQKELSYEAGVEQPTMALTLARMERDGIVLRRPNPRDGRSTLYVLTASAHAQVAHVKSALDAVEHRVAVLLKTEDLVAVRSALRLIGTGLTEERRDASDKSKKAATRKTGDEPIVSTSASGELNSSTPKDVISTPQKPKSFREPGTELDFPIGFEITTSRNKRSIIASVEDDSGWVLHDDGETYGSLFDLSTAVFGDAGNYWIKWKYKSQGERLIPLDKYRHERR